MNNPPSSPKAFFAQSGRINLTPIWEELGVVGVIDWAHVGAWETLLTWAKRADTAYSDKTFAALKNDFTVFCRWCAALGASPLPASPTTIRHFLFAHVTPAKDLPDDLRRDGFKVFVELQEADITPSPKQYKLASLKRLVSSLSRIHGAANLEDPTRKEDVRLALKTCGRLATAEQVQKAGFGKRNLKSLLELEINHPREEQDLLIALVAYQTGMRSQSLRELQVSWIEFVQGDDGEEWAEVTIKRSKTDQEGKMQQKKILATGTTVRLKSWLSRYGISEGPVFRPLRGTGKKLKMLDQPITTKSIREASKRLALRLNLDPSEISSHSFRIGGALDLAEKDADTLEIMRYGGWKSERMPLRYTEKVKAKKAKITQISKDL